MSGTDLLLSIPENNLPSCWNDETRMNVLYAPFRNRSVNPPDWDSKLLFWKNLICQCCSHSKVYTFKAEDLQKLFIRNGRPPACLNIVIDEMYKNGDIKPIEQFLEMPAQTWGKWATDVFVVKPMLWSFTKIKDKLTTPITDHNYVHLAAVKDEAEKLLTSIPCELKNKVISLQELVEVLGVETNRTQSIRLLLHYLVCSGKADMRKVNSKSKQDMLLQNILIKFGDIKKINPISDNDVGIYILEQNEKTLTANLEKLENNILSIVVEAKSYLSKGHRQMAKNCLRKKHEMEKCIIKRANALHNVQALLLKVRDADTDAQVLDSYKLALSTLKQSFKETGLSEDAVANTMTDLGDVLDIHEDIQSSLSQSFTGSDTELEDELAELMANDDKPAPPKPPSPLKPSEDSDTQELERRLHILKLPEVPSTSSVTAKNKVSL